MNKVYLASVGTRSGKSVLSIGLAMNYPGRVGFYKPFRENTINMDGQPMDQDAVLLAKVLKLEGSEKLSPFMYDIFDPVSLDDVVSSYRELSKGKEFMIIEGSRDFANGCSHGVSHIDIAKALGAPMVLVSSQNHQAIDSVFMFKSLCDRAGVELLGVVINKATGSKERGFLDDKGIAVLGEIPVIPELRTFRVSEITERMGAKVVAGMSGTDKVVEDVIVGAMSPQAAVQYMRRSKRKAVITGGDRTEILLAALSTSTSCIIVTGGIMPVRTVLSRADEIGVPILLTEDDTLTAAEAVEHLIARIDPKDTEKIDLITKAIKKNVDLERIW